MGDFFKTLVDSLRDGKKIFGALFIFSGLILSLPSDLLLKLYIPKIEGGYATIAGFVFLLSFAFFAWMAIEYFYEKICIRTKNRKKMKDRQKFLHNLNPAEKAILNEFLTQTTVIKTSISYLHMDGLIAKEIVLKAPACHNASGDASAYNIKPWAQEYLEKNPDLLK